MSVCLFIFDCVCLGFCVNLSCMSVCVVFVVACVVCVCCGCVCIVFGLRLWLCLSFFIQVLQALDFFFFYFLLRVFT